MILPIAKPPSLESPIGERVTWAEDCFRTFGDRLLGDLTTRTSLKNLERILQDSHRWLAETGVVGICRECDIKEGGSCCGAGLEKHYSGTLLLINLLLGVHLPHKHRDPASCFFLTPTGCLLQARHVICVNYLCTKITDRIDPSTLSILREKEGIELDCLFRLNERISKGLRNLEYEGYHGGWTASKNS